MTIEYNPNSYLIPINYSKIFILIKTMQEG